jgi:magnesium-transporting ATPase (P-type)
MMVQVNKYETKYYASNNIEDIILELKTNVKNRPSTEEPKNRLTQFGLNIIRVYKKIAWWQELFGDFKSYCKSVVEFQNRVCHNKN